MKYILLGLLSLCLLTTSSVHAGQVRILHLCSYHHSYAWTAGIEAGIRNVLDPHPEVSLNTFYMDSKRQSSPEQLKRAALLARKKIEEWQPDLIITSDDNAIKHVIVPYFKDGDIPVVFCGVNWSADEYGLSPHQVTGMIEVQLIDQFINQLRPHARGNRIALLKGDDFSARKEAEFFEKTLATKIDKRFVRHFNQWKTEYRKLQNEADILLLGNPASIQGWNPHEAQQFTDGLTKIPTGNWNSEMAPYSLLTLAILPQEQGEWAARTALDIIGGKPVSSIPPVKNRRAKVIINTKLAHRLNIRFSDELMEIASFVSPQKPKVFYVNSYAKGYAWSDDIEKGLFRALQIKELKGGHLDSTNSKIDFRMFRLKSKNRSEDEIRQAAANAHEQISSWDPDVLIVSDDNAVRYLALPYFGTSTLPVIFTGINHDTSLYEIPTDHITGMVEVEPIEKTLTMLQSLTEGTRLGYLGADNVSMRQTMIDLSQKTDLAAGRLVGTVAAWQQEYLKLQQTVDMLLPLSPIGVDG